MERREASELPLSQDRGELAVYGHLTRPDVLAVIGLERLVVVLRVDREHVQRARAQVEIAPASAASLAQAHAS